MIIWETINAEAKNHLDNEPNLENYFQKVIFTQENLVCSIAEILSSKLNSDFFSGSDLKELIIEALLAKSLTQKQLENDLVFFMKQDPACNHYSTPLLFYKGFLGLASYRAANALWINNKTASALFLQNRASEIFGVDIHPAAQIEGGVMIDHASGVVIGETASIKKNVSIYQGVTLGGRGNDSGKRHPTILEGATIYASSTILGNILIGKNSIIAAGSLVLKNVQDNETVAGIPARRVKNLTQDKTEWDPGNSSL
jgi:serine O-acetyltransferase